MASPNKCLIKYGFTAYAIRRILNNKVSGLLKDELERLDIVQQLQELPLDKLEEIRKFIEEMPKE